MFSNTLLSIDLTQYLPYASLILYAFAGSIVLVEAICGWRNGLSRQILRTMFVALSALVAVFATDRLSAYLLSLCEEKTLWEIFELTKIPTIFKLNEVFIETLKGMDTELVGYILPLFVPFFTMPIAFAAIFLIANWVLRLFFKIFAGIGGLADYGHSDTNRFLSTFVGVAQGIVVAMILLLPLSGAVNIAHESVAAIQEEDPESASTLAITETYNKYVKPFDDNLLLTYTYRYGGNILIDRYSKSSVNNQELDMREKTIALVRIYAETTVFDEETAWDALTPEEEAAIAEINDQIGEDPYLALVVSGILRAGSSVVDDKIVKKSDIQEPFATLLSSILGIFETSNENNLHSDLTTVKNVYFILSDDGILKAMSEDGDITAALTQTDSEGKTIISKVIAELNLNERTKGITSALTDISFAILLNRTGMDGETLDQIQAVKDDVSDALNDVLSLKEEDYANHEAYVYAILVDIDQTLQNHDIHLDSDIIAQVADYIADDENFCDEEGKRVTEVSDADLTEFLLSYYDAYAAQTGK